MKVLRNGRLICEKCGHIVFPDDGAPVAAYIQRMGEMSIFASGDPESHGQYCPGSFRFPFRYARGMLVLKFLMPFQRFRESPISEPLSFLGTK